MAIYTLSEWNCIPSGVWNSHLGRTRCLGRPQRPGPVLFCDMISSYGRLFKSFVEHLWLVGGLKHGFYFSVYIYIYLYWECHHPNWRIYIYIYIYIYILGMSSSQLTNSIIFQRGRYSTNQNLFWPQQSLGNTDYCQYVFSQTEDEKRMCAFGLFSIWHEFRWHIVLQRIHRLEAWIWCHSGISGLFQRIP